MGIDQLKLCPPPLCDSQSSLQKRSDILLESVKRRQFLTSATTTTMVIYIFIYSTGYHFVSEPSQAGKRGKICTRTVQSDS